MDPHPIRLLQRSHKFRWHAVRQADDVVVVALLTSGLCQRRHQRRPQALQRRPAWHCAAVFVNEPETDFRRIRTDVTSTSLVGRQRRRHRRRHRPSRQASRWRLGDKSVFRTVKLFCSQRNSSVHR